MILIISTCEEKIHELEFVKPIEKILKDKNILFFTKHYKELKEDDLNKASKIIIAGTSLKDNKFIKDISYFQWIKSIDKPLLGICAGMQIILLIYNGKLKNKKEIGYYKENFIKEFLGMEGEQEVYHLHNNYVTMPPDFISFTKGRIPQAIKHKNKNIYCVLFHPEVRNEKLIEYFIEEI
jgi:GMP synthase-like glutamine amidotransferase